MEKNLHYGEQYREEDDHARDVPPLESPAVALRLVSFPKAAGRALLSDVVVALLE